MVYEGAGEIEIGFKVAAELADEVEVVVVEAAESGGAAEGSGAADFGGKFAGVLAGLIAEAGAVDLVEAKVTGGADYSNLEVESVVVGVAEGLGAADVVVAGESGSVEAGEGVLERAGDFEGTGKLLSKVPPVRVHAGPPAGLVRSPGMVVTGVVARASATRAPSAPSAVRW